MKYSTIRRALAAATVFATGAVLAPAAAHAQLPGADLTGRVVITDSTAVQVSVFAHTTADTISGSIRNTTGQTFRCAVPGLADAEHPAQVTEAQIVADSVEYYARNIYQESGFEAPMVGVLGTGSLYNMLPSGSAANSLGASTGMMMQIRTAQDAARLAGHTGIPRVGGNHAFNLGPNQSVTWTAALDHPNTATRTDFDAGALFFCTSNNQSYVFAGYEAGSAPVKDTGRLAWS